MSKKIKPITKTQAVVARFIEDYAAAHKVAPTLQEIASGLGYKSANSAAEMVARLQRDGWLTQQPGKCRSMRLLRKAPR